MDYECLRDGVNECLLAPDASVSRLGKWAPERYIVLDFNEEIRRWCGNGISLIICKSYHTSILTTHFYSPDALPSSKPTV